MMRMLVCLIHITKGIPVSCRNYVYLTWHFNTNLDMLRDIVLVLLYHVLSMCLYTT